MRFWIIVLIVVAVVWFLRRPRRRGKRMLRMLAWQCGGHFVPGGFWGTPTLHTAVGNHSFRLRVGPQRGTGGKYWVELRGSWPPGRVPIAPSRPAALSFGGRDASSGGGGRRLSQSLVATAIELERLPGTNLDCVRTEGGALIHTTLLQEADPRLLVRWFQMASEFYRMLLADTETGIAFADRPTSVAGVEADCPVCGTPPTAAEQVRCAACGAPHHAECWNYNGSCAIYGCRSKQAHMPQRVSS
jgi:hypothetical protein